MKTLQLAANQHRVDIHLFVGNNEWEQRQLIARQRAALTDAMKHSDDFSLAALFVGMHTPSSLGAFLVVSYLQGGLCSAAREARRQSDHQSAFIAQSCTLHTTIHAPQTVNPLPPSLALGAGGIVINHFSVPDQLAQQHLAALLRQETETVMKWQPGFRSANLHLGMDTPGVVNVALWESSQAVGRMMMNREARTCIQAIERQYPRRTGDVFALVCLVDTHGTYDKELLPHFIISS